MTSTEKKAKILAAAANFGWHSDLYWNEAKELEAEGKIFLAHTYTKTGRTVYRWRAAA